jgi:outer membrane lipoprotein-sorting protein
MTYKTYAAYSFLRVSGAVIAALLAAKGAEAQATTVQELAPPSMIKIIETAAPAAEDQGAYAIATQDTRAAQAAKATLNGLGVSSQIQEKFGHLPAADQVILQKTETVMNRLRKMEARFVQTSSNGGRSDGTIFLQRPGKIRIEYDDPTPVLVVADGDLLVYFDKDVEQVTYLGLNDTPLGVILQDDISWADESLTLKDISRLPGLIEITLYRTGREDEGELTLVFTQNPFELRQWRVKDPQGVMVQVTLLEQDFNPVFAEDTFTFEDPKAGQRFQSPDRFN